MLFTFNLSKYLRVVAASCFAIALVTTVAAPAFAQDRTAFMEAFKHSYQNPGDVDAALKYAEEAVKIGDYEAAIPPLERILMFNPELSEVRLEVGVLYYLLDSKDMAKKHFTTVSNDSNANDVLKNRANSYLTKL